MRKVSVLAAVLALLCLGSLAQAYITIETVPVGDKGNQADTRYATPGYGSVGYNYRIGKYEVTAGQYTAFLNAVAATDTYGLYNTSMWSDSLQGCKIQRSGSSGGYTYSVASDYANRPVNYVCWYDTLRFANWLTNGQGSGSTESGSYLITGGGVNSGTVTIPTAAQRKTWSEGTTVKWLLTSEDEWYKAAYYKNGVYSLYANGTNTAPVAGTASNYNVWPGGHTWDGSANGALEQNGTKDMMGNLWEWNEARSLRGGSFGDSYYPLQAFFSYSGPDPSGEVSSYGFRVSVVPEPASVLVLGSGLLGLAGLIRKRR